MYDVSLKNVTIIDGMGIPAFEAEIAIKGDEVVEVGKELTGASREIDGQGKVVARGFIDLHSHSDFHLFIDPRGESKVRQGVTTEIVGNCGGWAAPLHRDSLQVATERLRELGYSEEIPWSSMGEYLDHMESRGISVNMGALVGHGTIRAAVMGYQDRKPTENELEEMKRHLCDSMEAGCFGMSTGIYYAPGRYASIDELVIMSEIVRSYGGLHSTHMRDESNYNVGLMAAMDEALEMARRSGV